MNRLVRLSAALAVASLLLTACTGLGAGPSGSGRPTGSNLLFRVDYSGGFVPQEYIFTNRPGFVLLGDGRVIVNGPVIEIYPGPALQNLQVRRLTEAGIQAVLDRITATGLFDASHTFDAANQFVADANDTIFTFNRGSTQVVVSVYALGLLADPNMPGFSAAERDAHRILLELSNDLTYLEGWLPAADWAEPAWSAFEAEAMALLVTNADNEVPDASGLSADPRPWPVAGNAADFGQPSTFWQDSRCGVVTGNEAVAWLAELQQANTLTRWTSAGHRYQVLPRPLTPDEPLECPEP